MNSFDDILLIYRKLPQEERRSLVKLLYKETEIIHLDGSQVKHCPHCDGSTITKYGFHNQEQRYHCGQCNRTFKETTGTALGLIRKKELFLKFQEAMINEDYSSISKMSNRFDISIPTAFSWRHKILLSLSEDDSKFESETELDDLWMRYSQKGRKGLKYSKKRGGTSHKGDNNYQVKILTAVTGTQTEMKVSNIGRLSKSDIQRSIGGKITKNTVLISDKHQSIAAFAKDNKIDHYSFKASEHTTKDGKGVQLLNNIAKRLDTLINRTLCGVSTKYLQLYVNWFKFKENNKNKNEQINMQKHILSNKHTWDIYSNIEKIYANFIKNHSVRTYRCPQVEKFKAQSWNKSVITEYAFF